jgi:hypothetical protein
MPGITFVAIARNVLPFCSIVRDSPIPELKEEQMFLSRNQQAEWRKWSAAFGMIAGVAIFAAPCRAGESVRFHWRARLPGMD